MSSVDFIYYEGRNRGSEKSSKRQKQEVGLYYLFYGMCVSEILLYLTFEIYDILLSLQYHCLKCVQILNGPRGMVIFALSHTSFYMYE